MLSRSVPCFRGPSVAGLILRVQIGRESMPSPVADFPTGTHLFDPAYCLSSEDPRRTISALRSLNDLKEEIAMSLRRLVPKMAVLLAPLALVAVGAATARAEACRWATAPPVAVPPAAVPPAAVACRLAAAPPAKTNVVRRSLLSARRNRRRSSSSAPAETDLRSVQSGPDRQLWLHAGMLAPLDGAAELQSLPGAVADANRAGR